jgi:hypothetical protein
MNTRFEITPENHNEVFDKWRKISPEEAEDSEATPRFRIFISVEDIEQIQNAFEITLQTAENLVGGLHKDDLRKIMQLGYGLEEVKQSIIKKSKKVVD